MDSEFPDEGDEGAELAEAAALQLPAKLAHKKWKIRGLGYTEVASLFDDPNTSPDELRRLLEDIGTHVGEKHASAKESALSAATACIRRCARQEPDQTFEKLAHELTQSLSGKPAARDAALESLMMLTEAGRVVAAPALLNTLKTSKAPKVISESVAAFRQLVHAFGTSVVDPRPMASQLVLLFDHRNEPVRKEALKVCIELYRWLGAPFKTSLEQLKENAVNHDKHKAMLNKLEPYFLKADNGETLTPSRFVEGQVQSTPQKYACDDLKIASTVVRQKKGGLTAENEDAAVIPGQPFDLLAALAPSWFTDAIAKKWQERKAALDVLMGLIEPAECLDTGGNYTPLVQVLSNIVSSDSNVRVTATALQALGLLCRGLGSDFAPHSKVLLKDVMQKLGDAKISESAVSAMNEMAAQKSVPVALAIQQVEVVLSSSSSPNKMKKSCILWLSQFMNPDLKESIVNRLLKLLTKATKSTASDVRDAGVEGLKALVQAVGQEPAPVAQCLAALGKHIVTKVLGPGGKLESSAPNDLLNTAPARSSKVSSRTAKKPAANKTSPPSADLLKTAPIKNTTEQQPKPAPNSDPRSERPAAPESRQLERAHSLPNVVVKQRRSSVDCSAAATSRRATAAQVELATFEIEFGDEDADKFGTMDLAQHLQNASDATDREFVMRGKHAYGRGMDMNEQAFLLQELEQLRKLASQASAKLVAKDHASVPASDKSNRTVVNCSLARTSPSTDEAEASPPEQSFGFRDRASEIPSRSSGSQDEAPRAASCLSNCPRPNSTSPTETLGVSPTEPRVLQMGSAEPPSKSVTTEKPCKKSSAPPSKSASTEKPIASSEPPSKSVNSHKPWKKRTSVAAGPVQQDRSGGVLGVLSAMQNNAPAAPIPAADTPFATDLETSRKQSKQAELSLNIQSSANTIAPETIPVDEVKSCELKKSPSFKAAQKPGMSALRMLKKNKKRPVRRPSNASSQPITEAVGAPEVVEQLSRPSNASSQPITETVGDQ